MTRAWLRAYRAGPAIAGTTLLCVVYVLTKKATIPMGPGTPVQTTWLLLLGVVVLSNLPLYPSFGLLEQTFARARLNRTGRAAVAAALVTTAAVVVAAAAVTVVIWFILLAALCLLAAFATADKSWAVVLLVGAGTIGFDHMMISSPISRAMDTIGLPTAICVYALAWLAFVLLPGLRDS